MSDDTYLTIGEFQRTMGPLRKLIEDGFRSTHAKQDTTNGRVLAAEKSLAVLNKARLIDRTDSLEGHVQTLREKSKRDDDAAKTSGQRWSTMAVALFTVTASLFGGFGSALLIAYLKARFGW